MTTSDLVEKLIEMRKQAQLELARTDFISTPERHRAHWHGKQALLDYIIGNVKRLADA